MKPRSRSPTFAHVATGLFVLNGCGLVAGLGDPKQQAHATASGSPIAQGVAVGQAHACATVVEGLTSSETVRCWGSNANGELGVDPALVAASSRPAAVAAFPIGFVPVEMALAAGYSCAISKNNYLACWGLVPREGKTGVHRELPFLAYQPAVVDLLDKPVFPVGVVSPGPGGGCVTEKGELICWGAQEFATGRDGGVDSGATVSPPGYRTVAVGQGSACALGTSAVGGGVLCWGDDTFGQAGGSVGGFVPDPSPIELAGDFKQVAAGEHFACVLTGGGRVYCWGQNDRGQLGPGSQESASATPVEVPLDAPASALALGDNHACAVLSDGDETVDCWGDNAGGQLGLGPSGMSRASGPPSRVQRKSTSGSGGTEDLPHVIQIAAGGDTTCVVRINDPLVSCWGANDKGQAGQRGSAVVSLATPVAW